DWMPGRGYVAGREDSGAGLEKLVDHDAAIDIQPGGGGETEPRGRPDPNNHKVSGNRLSTSRFDPDDAVRSDEAHDVLRHMEFDAVLFVETSIYRADLPTEDRLQRLLGIADERDGAPDLPH